MAFSFSSPYLLNIIDFARRQGLREEDLLQDVPGLDSSAELESSPEKRYPERTYNALLEGAVEGTGDPWFGLHLGESLNLSAAGLVGQIAQTSATVGEALENICQFSNLGCQALPLSMEYGKRQSRMLMLPDRGWTQRSPVAMRHTADFFIAFAVRDMALLSWQDQSISGVEFGGRLDYPRDLQQAERVCGIRPKIGTRYAMNFPSSLLKQAIRSADYELHRMLIQYGTEKLQAMGNKEGISDAVRQSLISMARPELPDAAQVAENLHLGLRTLQRKLKEEGTSFRKLANEVREEMAIHHLKNSDLQIAEIAYMLGYAEPAAFVRSFKRWKGLTPGAFRLQGH